MVYVTRLSHLEEDKTRTERILHSERRFYRIINIHCILQQKLLLCEYAFTGFLCKSISSLFQETGRTEAAAAAAAAAANGSHAVGDVLSSGWGVQAVQRVTHRIDDEHWAGCTTSLVWMMMYIPGFLHVTLIRCGQHIQ